MTASRWTLWTRHRGQTEQVPQVRKHGTLRQCRIEARFLAEQAQRNQGKMPYPYLDCIVVRADDNVTSAFRSYDDPIASPRAL